MKFSKIICYTLPLYLHPSFSVFLCSSFTSSWHLILLFRFKAATELFFFLSCSLYVMQHVRLNDLIHVKLGGKWCFSQLHSKIFKVRLIEPRRRVIKGQIWKAAHIPHTGLNICTFTLFHWTVNTHNVKILHCASFGSLTGWTANYIICISKAALISINNGKKLLNVKVVTHSDKPTENEFTALEYFSSLHYSSTHR